MFEKASDFVSGAFIVFYVAISHFMEVHALCLVALVAGVHLIAKSVLGYSPLRLLGKVKASKAAR